MSKSQENEIRQSFDYTYVELHCPENNENFSLILETFQKDYYEKEDNNNDNCNICSEKKKLLSLLLWTTFQVEQTIQMILATF